MKPAPTNGFSQCDDSVIMFEDAACAQRRIIVGLPFGDRVVAAFASIAEMQEYLCADEPGKIVKQERAR